MGRIIHKIRKILRYLPILWKDEDWDYGYLLYLMEFKFLRMADCIESNDVIVAAGRVTKQLRYAALLTNRMHGDDERNAEYLQRLTRHMNKYMLGWWD